MIEEDLAEGKEACKIPVVNTEDNEALPFNFHYISENVESAKSYEGCKCIGECKPSTCACMRSSSINILKDNKIDLCDGPPDYYENVLFECNVQTCQCRGKCEWRLTPELFNIKLELFKTPKAGWAVRSRQFIEAGTFVAEFVGEVVTHLQQEHRPLEYAYKLTTLDKRQEDIFIDPFKYGNITRFFNHNCFENVQPFRFYSNHRDKSRGSIGFFARRDILPGDELTIDYGEEWWRQNIDNAEKSGSHFYCHCDWLYCLNPPPGKPQSSPSDARAEILRIVVDKHRKLMAWKRTQEKKQQQTADKTELALKRFCGASDTE